MYKIHKGEVCDRCGWSYLAVYVVPDDVWAKIMERTDGSGLLCPRCCDELAREKGIYLYWEAAPNVFPTLQQYKPDEDILFYAFRYALGRKTYAVGQVSEKITALWPELSEKFKTAVLKIIKSAIQTGTAGDAIDIATWKCILALEGE